MVIDQDPPLVTVQWQMPRNAYGVISGYRLNYGIKGESNVAGRIFNGDVFRFQTGFLGMSVRKRISFSHEWVL